MKRIGILLFVGASLTLAAIGCLEGAGSAAPSAGMLASSRS